MKSNFIKFLRKAFIFLLPFFILIVLAEILIGRSIFYHVSEVYYKVSNFSNKANEVKILVFGSSHANNAIFDSDSPYIFNMANPGQDLKNDLFLLNFLGDLHGIEAVIFTVSYFSFEYSEDKEWPFRVRDYLDVQTLKPEKNIIHFKNWLYDRSKLLNYNLSPYQILKYYLKKNSSLEELPNTSQQIKATSLEPCDSILKNDAEHRALPLQARYHNTSSQSIEKIFQEMLDICRKQNKKVFLVALPFSKIYNLGIEEKWKMDFDQTLNHYKIKYNIPVLNYSQDSRFENDCTLFQNADHLNMKGAMKFTKILLEDIKKQNDEF